MTSDPTTTPEGEAAQFWESVYRERPWSERPRANPLLAAYAEPLAPGRALDLGCGTGGDALWLAEHGWQATAVDIAAAALEQVKASAEALGLADAIITERHDLSRSFPAGRFDLVSAQYLHTPFPTPRHEILRTAAEALLPGGRLLVVDHGSIAPWSWNHDPSTRFPTPHEVAAELELDPAGWTAERAEAVRRLASGPGGQTAEVVDHVLIVRRADR